MKYIKISNYCYLFMKIIFLLLLLTFSIDIQARPKSSLSSFDTLDMSGSRQSRTGRKSGWGNLNENPSNIDLSEWGGEVPTCAIAPECPICIK